MNMVWYKIAFILISSYEINSINLFNSYNPVNERISKLPCRCIFIQHEIKTNYYSQTCNRH